MRSEAFISIPTLIEKVMLAAIASPDSQQCAMVSAAVLWFALLITKSMQWCFWAIARSISKVRFDVGLVLGGSVSSSPEIGSYWLTSSLSSCCSISLKASGSLLCDSAVLCFTTSLLWSSPGLTSSCSSHSLRVMPRVCSKILALLARTISFYFDFLSSFAKLSLFSRRFYWSLTRALLTLLPLVSECLRSIMSFSNWPITSWSLFPLPSNLFI